MVHFALREKEVNGSRENRSNLLKMEKDSVRDCVSSEAGSLTCGSVFWFVERGSERAGMCSEKSERGEVRKRVVRFCRFRQRD